jgi:hypothetical protein
MKILYSMRKQVKRIFKLGCRDYIIVWDLPELKAGMPLCRRIDSECPYAAGVFSPRRTTQAGGYTWNRRGYYIVCGNATQEDSEA